MLIDLGTLERVMTISSNKLTTNVSVTYNEYIQYLVDNTYNIGWGRWGAEHPFYVTLRWLQHL